MIEFHMPFLGADMEHGTVVEWRVHPGDHIARGDIVVLVETDKGLIEVETFDSGIIDSIAVPEGTQVPVGAVLATIRPDGEAPSLEPAPAPSAAAPAPAAAVQPAAAPPSPAPAPAAPSTAGRVRASPLARRLAESLGVDLATLVGSGEGGAVTRADVERAAAGRAPAPPPTAPPTPAQAPRGADHAAAMRRAIAAAMVRSKREIPHYYLSAQIDMSRAVAWLAAENARRPVDRRILPVALLLRSVALATREVPEMNGFWVDGEFRPGQGVHLGVAISLRQGGLVAPAIHDVDHKDLDQIMRDLLDLVKRARAGVLRSSEISDATLTVTNLGDQGVESVFGVIYPPQVALVGFGRVVERPWSEHGMLGSRPVMTASLSGDHRASDGHRGGRFLAAIDRLLQEPERP